MFVVEMEKKPGITKHQPPSSNTYQSDWKILFSSCDILMICQKYSVTINSNDRATYGNLVMAEPSNSSSNFEIHLISPENLINSCIFYIINGENHCAEFISSCSMVTWPPLLTRIPMPIISRPESKIEFSLYSFSTTCLRAFLADCPVFNSITY